MELLKNYRFASAIYLIALFFVLVRGDLKIKDVELSNAKLIDPSHKMLRGETFHPMIKDLSVSSSKMDTASNSNASMLESLSSSESVSVSKMFPMDLPSDKVQPTLAYDLNPKFINLYDDGFILKYNSGETRVRSEELFNNGVFSVDFKCPVHFEGLKVSLYLASEDQKADGISMEFLGNEPQRARTNTMVKGYIQPYTVDFGWNCSQRYHTYTIVWTPSKIMWLVDNTIMRVLEAADEHEGVFLPPSTAMRFYAAIERPHMWGAGTFDASRAPFKAEFKNFRVASIPEEVELIAPSSPQHYSPLSILAIPRCRETINIHGSELTISWGEKAGCGGNPHSPAKYTYGHFSTMIQCPKGNSNGLVTSFYLSSYEGRPRNQDEINFQFLGKDNTRVQTNFWVNGEGGNERTIPLGFDCSEQFHNYTIIWTTDSVEWLVDSKVVRKEFRSKLESSGKGFPTKASYLYMTLWNANNAQWSGKYEGKDAPFFAKFNKLQVFSPSSDEFSYAKPMASSRVRKNLGVM